jgi:small subunit ribosomal protein S7
MGRKKITHHRQIASDAQYGSKLITKFINYLMFDGRKETAEKILYASLEALTSATHTPPLKLFNDVIAKASPLVEVKSKRVGGATYQIPAEVSTHRATILAMRWIIQSARARSERGMLARLIHEFRDISDGRGETMKKRDDVHKMAESNRVFAVTKNRDHAASATASE